MILYRLKERILFWKEVLEEPEAVLRTIESGHVLPLKSEPTPLVQGNQQSALPAVPAEMAVLVIDRSHCEYHYVTLYDVVGWWVMELCQKLACTWISGTPPDFYSLFCNFCSP